MSAIPTDTAAKVAFQDSLFHDNGLFTAQRSSATASFDQYLQRAGGRDQVDVASPSPPMAPAPAASSQKPVNQPRDENADGCKPYDEGHGEPSDAPRSEPAVQGNASGEAPDREAKDAQDAEHKDPHETKNEDGAKEDETATFAVMVQGDAATPKPPAEAAVMNSADIEAAMDEAAQPAAHGEDAQIAAQPGGKPSRDANRGAAPVHRPGQQAGVVVDAPELSAVAAETAPAEETQPEMPIAAEQATAGAESPKATQTQGLAPDHALLSTDGEKPAVARRRAGASRHGAREAASQAESRDGKTHDAAAGKAAAQDSEGMAAVAAQSTAEGPQAAVQDTAAAVLPALAADASLKAAAERKSSAQSTAEAAGPTDARTQSSQRAAAESSQKGAATPSQAGADTGAADRARFVQRVAGAFRSIGDQGGAVRLKLSPPELGSLRMEVTVRNGVMNARIEAESEAARTLLMENLPILRERLAQQDIKVQQFQVDLRNPSQGNLAQQGGNPFFGDQRGGRQAPYAPVQSAVEEAAKAESPVVRRGLEGSRLNVIV